MWSRCYNILEDALCVQGVSGVIDQTRGILNHIAETCPGRFHDNIQYVTVRSLACLTAAYREITLLVSMPFR